MNQQGVRRGGRLAVMATLALVVLTACGRSIEGEIERHDITRVPVMSDAAAQATREAASQPASPVAGQAGTPSTPAAAPAAPAAAQTIEIASHDIFFEPNAVTIPANTDVTVTLPNLGAAPHNFSIDALNVSVDIAPGDTKEVVINAVPGTYEFYCNVPGHKEAGMIGTLTVSAEAAPAAPAVAPAVPASPAAAPAPAETSAPAPAAAAQTVEIVSHDIFFDPKEVTIPANADVTVTLPNQGAAPHNFSIDALGISVDIAPGDTKETVINAAPGEYEFYCNVPGHKEAGMVGKLIVTESAGAAPAAPAGEAPAAEVAATPASPAAGEQASSPAAEAPAAAAPATEGVTIASHDIFFEPDEVTIPANTDVTVTLPNEGAAPHNFSIDALGISLDQAPGETHEVVINAPPGTYEFYCDVPGHKQAGMVGTLTVQ